MKIIKIILQGAVLAATVMPAAFAQQAAPNYNAPTIIQSGHLTAGETRNLETKESALKTEEHNMRMADNGKLTTADRAKLNHQRNRLSRQIYDKKHNGRVQ
jgi:hypothetical protein